VSLGIYGKLNCNKRVLKCRYFENEFNGVMLLEIRKLRLQRKGIGIYFEKDG
jgi:hypothetical protein